MPRANRVVCKGYVWHITHRCHEKSFLLKFSKDRRRWRHWLFEAKRRYRLSVLNYIATSNHVHLLVADRGAGEIPRSMQLIAGRTAQEFNNRKNRRGAFWEDRYHATAVQTDKHLAQCITYIDLNMVRAGVVKHPSEWDVSGFSELRRPWKRKCVIDVPTLCRLRNVASVEQLLEEQTSSLDQAMASSLRQPEWTEAVGIGDEKFLGELKSGLGLRGRHRVLATSNKMQILREDRGRYLADSIVKKQF